jgi:long-chain acyl-CoA synthetase
MKNFTNLPQIAFFQAQSFQNPKALNFKENGAWRSFSNAEFYQKICYFAFGLKEIGLQKDDVLAIFSYQNPIWLIADLGSILAGAVTVPIFHNISQENLFYEISDSKVKYIFTDSANFLEVVSKSSADLKIITYGFKSENHYFFDDLMLLGQKAFEEKKYSFEDLSNDLQPEKLATIIYTSGSTGMPKGVELSHQNLISQIQDTEIFFPLKQEDVILSFLPLAHIFERMVMMFYLTQGVSIYFVDDIKNIGNFLKEVKPSLMTTVPRMLEKVYAKINEGAEKSNFVRRIIAKKALESALLKDVDRKKNFLDKLFDSLVYKKFRQAMGGNMRMIICGGSSLSNDMERFYRNIGIDLFCGYGLTESSPVLAANCEKFHKFATVGKKFTSVELKIASDGELLARGKNIMMGYHNRPEETAEMINDGWLKTGDLAQIDEEGFVKIVGRKKELFKTANGKYVSPVPIEQKLVQKLGFLIGAIIIAEGKKFVSALLFPDFEILEKTKKKLNFKGEDENFLDSDVLSKFVEREVSKINKSLDHWQQIQKFQIAKASISIESGDITPSMKLKRNVLEEKYQNIISEFYTSKE